MSKKIDGGSANPHSDCYVVYDGSVGNLEGRVLTIIESLGLKDSQEKAVKDLLRNEIWQWTNAVSSFVWGEHADKIWELVWDCRKNITPNIGGGSNQSVS